MIKNEKLDALAEKTSTRIDWSRLRSSSSRLLPFFLFVILFVIFSIFANNFFTVSSVLNLLVQTSTFTILGIGAAMVLVVGCVDFSLGAIIALGGTAVVVFAAMGLPVWESMILASLVGGVVGLANGFLVARGHLPSFIVTFAMAMLIYGLLSAFGAFAGARLGPPPHPENLEHLGDLASIPAFRIVSHGANGVETVIFPGISWIVMIMVVIALLSHLVLTKTRFGRYAFLVGANSEAARFSGIKVVRVKIIAFWAAGCLAGLVGVLLTSRLGGPPGGAVGYEMIAITCAMIGGASLSGGAGSVWGTVIGSFLIMTLQMGLTMVNVNHASLPVLFNGIIVLIAVYLDQIRTRK